MYSETDLRMHMVSVDLGSISLSSLFTLRWGLVLLFLGLFSGDHDKVTCRHTTKICRCSVSVPTFPEKGGLNSSRSMKTVLGCELWLRLQSGYELIQVKLKWFKNNCLLHTGVCCLFRSFLCSVPFLSKCGYQLTLLFVKRIPRYFIIVFPHLMISQIPLKFLIESCWYTAELLMFSCSHI